MSSLKFYFYPSEILDSVTSSPIANVKISFWWCIWIYRTRSFSFYFSHQLNSELYFFVQSFIVLGCCVSLLRINRLNLRGNAVYKIFSGFCESWFEDFFYRCVVEPKQDIKVLCSQQSRDYHEHCSKFKCRTYFTCSCSPLGNAFLSWMLNKPNESLYSAYL